MRNGNVDIYAQKINSSGEPKWGTNGIAICINNSWQQRPKIISDGFGGAIIAWWDQRDGNIDIYAQQVDKYGSIIWYNPSDNDFNGVPVCTALGSQLYYGLCSDNVGGAIIAWVDQRPPYSALNQAVYAQRIDFNGAPYWNPNGESICTIANYNYVFVGICSDQEGGAIIVWNDNRTGKIDQYSDIYAQRINSTGDPQWAEQGMAICAAPFEQYIEHGEDTVVSDGNGGALIVWEDNRNGPETDIYAQKVDSTGTIQWQINGKAICTQSGEQDRPCISNGTNGGALIAWRDERNGVPKEDDIYAQYITSQGVAQWVDNGIPICNSNYVQLPPRIVCDETGSAIIVWEDGRNEQYSNRDIYAYRVTYTVALSSTGGDDDDDDDDDKDVEIIPGYDLYITILIIFTISTISTVILLKNKKRFLK